MEGEARGDGFPEVIILVNIGETRGHCVSTLTPVESEPRLVCSTSWLCKPLSKVLLCSFVSTYLKWGLIISILKSWW